MAPGPLKGDNMSGRAPPTMRADRAGSQQRPEGGDRPARVVKPEPLQVAPPSPWVQRAAAGAEGPDRGGGLVVDDDVRTLTAGQMAKSQFLAQLRGEVCAAADGALRRAGRDSRGCPYIEKWLDHYTGRPAAHLERAIRKFVPAAARVATARDYIPLVGERVAQGVNRWVDTGRIPDDIPDELRAGLAGGGVAGALAGAASSVMGAIGGAIGGAVSAIGRLFFKSEAGGARSGVDGQAVSARLGRGRPLDGTARARMESAFGYDFAHVRVHDDGKAAALSRDLDARAFTVGEHVAFADGGYRPGTPVGDALLAHELAHVVQQGGGRPSGTPAPSGLADEALERDADRAAEGAARSLHAPEEANKRAPRERRPRLRSGLRLSRCSKKPPKTPAAAQPGPANYDATHHTIIAMPSGLDAGSMEDNLEKHKAAGTLTSWKAEGVRRGSDEEVAILYAIWQMGHTRSWDREIDLVTEVGPGKRGAITIRIDAGGNAVGTLVSQTAPTVAASYATVADARTGLKARYKLADVIGERGKAWSVAELNKVAAAWSRLDPADAAALEGFTLIRTDDTLASTDGKPVAGLTVTGDTLAPDQSSSARVRQLKFADRAFASDSIAFVGDASNAAPASASVLLHEAGHAQEVAVSAAAESRYVEAQVAGNAAIDRVNLQSSAADNAMNAARHTWLGFPAKKQTVSKGYTDAFRVAHRAIDALRLAPDVTQGALLQDAARAAVKARITARDALPSGDPTIALYASAETEQDSYLAAAEALHAANQAVETARATQTASLDPTGARSARLQKFVDFVNAKGIRPFTKYAQDNWPAHPEEFYAEAFSFWRADPAYLASSHPELKQWFDRGEHRN